MRTISSTVVGQLADSVLFIAIAFAGLLPAAAMVQLVLCQWLFKCAYEILATPLTYMVVNFLKRAENMDHYDRDTDFSPLAVGS
jgi:hypothetical protein